MVVYIMRLLTGVLCCSVSACGVRNHEHAYGGTLKFHLKTNKPISLES